MPRLLLSLALALLALGCREQNKNEMDPRVAATVNGEVISRADFQEELGVDVQSADGLTPQTPEQLEPFKRALIQTLIERTLLLQAAKQASVTVTPEEVDRGVLRISSDYASEGFDQALAQGQMSAAALKQKTAALLTIEKLFQQQVYPRIAVTEDEIRQYFQNHPDEFKEPEKVRAAQIVVKNLDEAKKLQQLLRSGKKFADLARRYSLSADAKVGGDLGFFPRGVMPPEFDQVAFSLSTNEVSEVISTEYGFHLFKVLERRPATRKELVEVRGVIEERLLKEKRTAGQRDYLKLLRDKAEVRINEQALAQVMGKSNQAGSRIVEP